MVFILDPRLILGERYRFALYGAIGVGVSVVLVVFWLNIKLCNRTENRAKRMVLKNRLDRALKQNPVGQVYWSSAIEGARLSANQ